MKTFLPRFLTLIQLLILFSCSPARQHLSGRNLPIGKVEQSASTQVARVETIKAPWEIWSIDTYGNPDLVAAESAILNNSFDEANSLYRQAIRTSSNPNTQDQARQRLIGTLMKLGKSQEALQEISKYTSDLGITPQQLRPDYALFAAWSYIHQSQADQSLAWFKVANQIIDDGSLVADSARKGTRSLLKSLSPTQFESVSQKWSSDGVIGKFIKAEKIRRIKEGETPYSLAKFFSPQFYRGQAVIDNAAIASSVGGSQAAANLDKITIGVLLPLTGKFAEHAIKVKEGIQLASKDFELKFGDTQGDPAIAVSEYERLVNQEKVSVVLGPLLVATSEAVGDRSISLGVPVVSFTKKEGLPGIGQTVFRLGATASNQVSELLDYSVDKLSLNNYAIIYPSNENSGDFVSEFEKKASSKSASISAREMYVPGDSESIRIAVERVIAAHPQGVFIPDTLESCFSVLEQLKSQGLTGATLLGPALWSDPVAIRGYGQLLEGAVFVSLFNAQAAEPNIVNFVQSFRAEFKHDPDLLAAQSYDATSFVIQALQSGTGSAEQRLTAAQPYLGVTGELNVQADGEISRKISVMNVSKGDVNEVMFAGSPRGVMPPMAQ